MNTYQPAIKTIYLVTLSVLLTLLSACIPAAPIIELTSPTANHEYINESVDISMTYAQGTKLSLFLNGRNLDAVTNFKATSANASSKDFEYALKQGSNRLVIKQRGSADLVRKFTFDNSGPKVVFSSIVRDVSNLNIEGDVIDASGIEFLSINGLNIALTQNGGFATTIPQADAYGVKAGDENGIKSYDHYLAPGTELNPMIRSSVDETLIDDLSPIIANAIIVPKEEAIFDAINPLIQKSLIGELFGIVNIKVDLKKFQGQVDEEGNLLGTATVNSLLVSAESSDGTVTADISVVKPLIALEVYINNLTEPLGLNIRADRLDINGANIRLAIDENDHLVVEFSEDLPIDLTNTSIEIENTNPIVGLLFNNVISDLIVSFVADSIEGVLAKALPSLINDELAGRLDEVFAGLNIDNDELRFKLGIAHFGKDDSKILADLTAQYQSKKPKTDDYAMGVKTYSSIDQLTGEIDLGGELPAPNDFGQINATVSFDFINQAMLLAFEQGLLDINLVGRETVIGAENINNAQTPNGTLWIQVKPSIPELQLSGDSSQANVDIKLENLELNVRTRNSSGWNDLVSLKMALNIFAGFGFKPESNTIFLESLAQAPKVDVMQVNALGASIPSGLANSIVKLTVPTIADLLLNIFKVKLPIPVDFPMQIKNISAVGEGSQHLSVSFDVDLFSLTSLNFQPEEVVDHTE